MTKIILLISIVVVILLIRRYYLYREHIPQQWLRTCRWMFVSITLVSWNQLWLIIVPNAQNPLLKLAPLSWCITVLSFLYDIKNFYKNKKNKKMSIPTSFQLKKQSDMILSINDNPLETPLSVADFIQNNEGYYNAYDELCIDVDTEEQVGNITLEAQSDDDEGSYYVVNIPWENVEFIGPRPKHRPHPIS